MALLGLLAPQIRPSVGGYPPRHKFADAGAFRDRIARLSALLLVSVVTSPGGPSPAVVLENQHFRYEIAADGRNLAFLDKASQTDHLQHEPVSFCASLRAGGKDHRITRLTQTAPGHLMLEFGEQTGPAVVAVESRQAYLRFKVESVQGEGVESLTFLDVPLTLQGRPDESFGACALSLNLITRVDALPALQSRLRASCFQKFGLERAQVALVATPMAQLLPALQQVLTEAKEMPLCPVAGPWAQELAFNHGSYLFNFGALTEANAGEWIDMTRRLGVTQIDHHGGGDFFRFGDFVLNSQQWPDGWTDYQRIVDRLHQAGVDSIFHTYAFFIDKRSRYVTPVPDRRLDAFRTFTLAREITAEATDLEVVESTKGLNTITGFFEHNSVILHLDDELVTFSAVSQEPPWRFTGLQRGAFGTQPARHEKGAPTRHLKECFGLLVPNPESSLFNEIARNHAEIVNQCRFAGIYLDAIDGASILRGPDECWYWADKFVFEIQRHLDPPVGMEMSAMWHHFWQYRTRWQAWDYPSRGHKAFLDRHAAAVHGGLLLPLHLGWWNFQSFDPPQVEPTFPDVIEYLGAKLIGWDAGISLTAAINPQRLREVPLFARDVEILRTCEELRRNHAFDDSVRARLREPGQDFSLTQDEAGQWRFRPAQSAPHTASLAEPWTLSWEITNRFAPQPIQLRLEILMAAGDYDDPGNPVLADPSDPQSFPGGPVTAQGVSAALRPIPGLAGRSGLGELTATNTGAVARNAAWTRYDRRFNPPLNLSQHQALGVRVAGDAQGALLAFRLESPRHLAFGAVADRYLPVDFAGLRTITLIESESTRWNDYVWNDGKWLYNVYRETIRFDTVDSFTLWCQNLAPATETRCRLGPVKALPMLPATVLDPVLAINGANLTFPVEMVSGSFLEFDGRNPALVYGAKGEPLGAVAPRGQIPTLDQGPHRLQFSCSPNDGPPPRVKLVLVTHGPPL